MTDNQNEYKAVTAIYRTLDECDRVFFKAALDMATALYLKARAVDEKPRKRKPKENKSA